MQLSLVDPQAFRDGFSLATFLAGLAKEVLDPKDPPVGPKPDTSTAAAAARVALEKSRAMLELMDKAESEAVYAHGEVARSVTGLQAALQADQAKYQKALSSAQRHSERVREAFREVEERSNRVGQVGTRLGDRLQRADALRSRALELVSLFEHLALFAALPEGDGAFAAHLPGLFWEDRRLAEAAAVARKLRTLTCEAENAKQRSRLAGAAAAAAAAGSGAGDEGGRSSTGGGAGPSRRELAPQAGGLDYCTRRLAAYCTWLENRVVGRFDSAFEDDNLRVMGECARIMAAFDRERAIIQRYISLLPAFQSTADDVAWVRQPAVAADDAAVAERLRPLSRLYAGLGEMVEMESTRMAGVFPHLRLALELLAVKVFEDKVHMALERLLEDTAADAFSQSTSFSSGRSSLLDDDGEEEEEGGGEEEQDEGEEEEGGYASDGGSSGAPPSSGSGGGGSEDEEDEDGEGSEGGRRRGRRPQRRPVRPRQPAAAAAQTSKRPPPSTPSIATASKHASLRSSSPHASIMGLKASGGAASRGGGGAAAGPRRHRAHRHHRRRSGGGGGGGAGAGYGSDGDGGSGGGSGSSSSSGGPSVLALHLYLRLLAGAYVRTGELAEQVEAATHGQVEVGPLVDAAFEEVLKLYPAPELQWLDMMAEKELASEPSGDDPAGRPELTSAVAESLIRRNAEAVQRCMLLCPGSRGHAAAAAAAAASGGAAGAALDAALAAGAAAAGGGGGGAGGGGRGGGGGGALAAAVRLLYVGEAPYDGTWPGSLMEHLPRYLINGVEREMELTLQRDARGDPAACNMYRTAFQPPPPPGSKGPPPPPVLPPPVTRSLAASLAQAYVDNRVVPVLAAVDTCVRVVARLQDHHNKVVLPALGGAAAEVSACAAGLGLALRAVEAAVLGVMGALVDMLVIQAEKVLMYEQRAAEFLPAESGLDAAALDRPTGACLLVCALFEALGRACRAHLDGPNLTSCLLDVGCRMHATFLNHMQQYCYNAAGALRWRNDVAAYSEALQAWGLGPALDGRLAAVGGLCGILVVEPEQLLPLVNGTLRLDHREAIKYVRLRQDFHLARVQGRSLQQVFGEDSAVVPGGGGPPAGAGPMRQA